MKIIKWSFPTGIRDFLTGLIDVLLSVKWSASRRYRLQPELCPESQNLILEVPYPNTKSFITIIIIPPNASENNILTVLDSYRRLSALWIAISTTERLTIPDVLRKKLLPRLAMVNVPVHALVTQSYGPLPSFITKALDLDCHYHHFNSSMLFQWKQDLDDASFKTMWEENEANYMRLLKPFIPSYYTDT